MPIWSSEIKELERLYESLKGQLPELEKELGKLIKADDDNMILLYSRRCLEVIITDLCECELKRPRKTEPLKGIIDKLNKEEKVPSNIITSMDHLNSLSAYGAHPKDFDPEQVKPVLVNLDIIIKWYLRYKGYHHEAKPRSVEYGLESSSVEVPEAAKSIAVLSFVDMSPEKDQEYFCDGIAEEIIHVLSQIGDLKVIARSSAFAFKNKQADLREVGRILDVETILEGSIRKSKDLLRITAQLIKVSDGSHIWSKRYDRDLEDVFAIQDEISQAIADNLKVRLLPESQANVPKRHSENIEAYNLYLKGMYHWQKLTTEGYRKAAEYFEQALQIDPDYALAYVGFGYVVSLSTFWGNTPPNEGIPKIKEYVKKALKIDNTLADAYILLGNINTHYFWNFKEAEKNFQHGLQINPSLSMSHLYYSMFLTFTGRHKEAISEAKRAQQLDPLSIFVNTYTGAIFDYTGLIDNAIEVYQITLSINPNFFITHYHLGRAYAAKGMIKEAIAELEIAVDLSDGASLTIATLAGCYNYIGKKDLADSLFERLKKKSETEYVPATSFYLIHRFRGEEALALDFLKKACNEQDSFLVWFQAHPFLIPEGSKYMKLVKEMGLDY
ncbi:MAG: tetratricopeptide repeat protein [Bacteroidales bacterium]|nr:tetratricopeptide repeat protein [Bacteroidales bacterium]